MTTHYYLVVKEINTGKTIFEDGFLNKHNVAEKIEEFPHEEFCYEIEEIVVPV